MLFLRNRKLYDFICLRYIKPFCTQNLSQFDDEYLIFKTGLSQEEQWKVLQVLNNANAEQLYRYNISKNRIKSIASWKNKKGLFKSLNDVLEVDGLGEKVLEKICMQIIKNNLAEVHVPSDNVNKVKYAKHLKDLTMPILPEEIRHNIKSVSGINITPVGVSWSRITRSDNEISDWNYENLAALPNKITPTETFELAISLVRKVVPSDVYVFESQNSMGQKSAISFNQQMELSAMLLALLNTSVKHNKSLNNPISEEGKIILENRVFFLKRKIPARLFGLSIGLETISSVEVVKKLLEKSEEMKYKCSPITLNAHKREFFETQSPANKDLLGQALLLTLSFLDLCVYKSKASINIVFQNAFRNKKI